jgi:hypothetical protein
MTGGRLLLFSVPLRRRLLQYCATRTITQEQKKTKDPWPGCGLQDAASEA